MPLISIIVPVYNVEKYLGMCIDSVLAQSFTNYEVILVDDGSPDNCGRICDEYVEKDNRVRVIHQENGGVSAARNAGLDVARGKYIYFLDSDDYMAPNLLELVVKKMESGLDMLVFNYWELDDCGSIVPNVYPATGEYLLKCDKDRKAFLINTLLTYKIGWAPWNRVYVRETIEKYHLRFADYRKIIAEDLYFCFCYCVHAEYIAVIDEPLYFYRLREGSLVCLQKKQLNIDRYNELSKAILEYLMQMDGCADLEKDFCTIHFMLVAKELVAEYGQSGLGISEFRDKVREKVADWDFFSRYLKKQMISLKKSGFSNMFYLEQWCYARYVLGGSYVIFRVQTKLLYIIWDVLSAVDRCLIGEVRRNIS